MVSVNTDLYYHKFYIHVTVFLQFIFTSFLKLVQHVQRILSLYTQHLKIERSSRYISVTNSDAFRTDPNTYNNY